jgi:uncharacterized membrane-anchored protein
MKPLYKGLAVALVHILIVLSLGAKLLYDRHTRPRIWVRTGSVDPDLPIRGRYLTLNLEVHVPNYKSGERNLPGLKEQLYDFNQVDLAVEDGKLVAHKSDRSTGMYIHTWAARTRTDDVFLLSSPVLFFIPEHAEVPRANRSTGDELWAEVTIPRKGPPRPIQLAFKHGQEWVPLTYR